MVEDNLQLYKELLKGDKQLTKSCRFVEEEWPGYHKLDEESQGYYK